MARKTKDRIDLLQGTLDMLILKTLSVQSLHGYGVVRCIQNATDDLLIVEEGSLYPALHRMEKRGLIRAQWGVSENNRRAKYYSLTRKGKKQLDHEISMWGRFTDAANRVLSLSEVV